MSLLYKIISFLFGLFSILEAFKYQLGGFTIYLGDIWYYLFAGLTFLISSYSFINGGITFKRCTGLRKKYYGIWILFFLLLILSLNIWSPILDYSINPYEPDGVSVAIKYAVKTVILIIILIAILLLPKYYQSISLQYFVAGFISAVYLHAVYSIVQLIFWYIFHTDIHTPFLKSWGVTEESVGHVLVNFLIIPIIRPSGIHWDPAYFGLWGTIVLLWQFYFSKGRGKYQVLFKVLNIVLLLTWFLSFSRTGYFALICTVGVMSIFGKNNKYIKRIRSKFIIESIIALVIISFGVFISLPEDVSKSLYRGIEYRFASSHDDEGTNRHLMYPLYVLEGTLHDPYHFFFGYGARNSSRSIYYSGEIRNFVDTEEAFDIESDLCKMMANYGFIYFIFYLCFNYKIIQVYIREKKIKSDSLAAFFLVSILSIFFAGIFYVYNDSKWVWFIYFYALLYLQISKNSIKNGTDRCVNNYCEF